MIISFFLLFFFFSLFEALFDNLRNYWGDMLIGSGSIVAKDVEDYDILMPLDPEHYFSVNELAAIEDIFITPRLHVAAVFEGYHNENKAVVNLYGIDVDKELQLTPDLYVLKGCYPERGKKEVVLFQELLGYLDIDVGDEIIIYANTIDGYQNYDLARVVGVLYFKDTQYFDATQYELAYAPLEFVRELIYAEEDQISEAGFRANNWLERYSLNKCLPDSLKLTSFWESTDMLYNIYFSYSFFRWLIFVIILVVVFISVYHNINLVVSERFREIGVYITFGARKSWILGNWICELTIYLLYCSLWGGLLAFLLLYFINSMGIYAINEVFALLLAGDELKINIKPANYLSTFGLMWIIACLSALTPVARSIDEKAVKDLFTNR